MSRSSRLAVIALSVAAVLGTSFGTAPAASAETTNWYSATLRADQVQPGPGDPTYTGSAVFKRYDDISTIKGRGSWHCPTVKQGYDHAGVMR